jgi:hypothetical protein
MLPHPTNLMAQRAVRWYGGPKHARPKRTLRSEVVAAWCVYYRARPRRALLSLSAAVASVTFAVGAFGYSILWPLVSLVVWGRPW